MRGEPYYCRLIRLHANEGHHPPSLSPAAMRLKARRLRPSRCFFWPHRSYIHIARYADRVDVCDPDNPPLDGTEVWGSGRDRIMARIAAHAAARTARPIVNADLTPQQQAMVDAGQINEDRDMARADLGKDVETPTSDTPSTPMQLHYVAMIERALDRSTRAQAKASAEAAGTEDDLDAAHARSLNNRSMIEAGGPCGCFYCLANFDTSEVVEWVDASKATALCPRCHIDIVLSARTDRIDAAFLHRMHDYWFDEV